MASVISNEVGSVPNKAIVAPLSSLLILGTNMEVVTVTSISLPIWGTAASLVRKLYPILCPPASLSISAKGSESDRRVSVYDGWVDKITDDSVIQSQ